MKRRPKRIGKYEVLGRLGAGGWGAVYRVRIPVIDRLAALKLLSPHPLLVDLLGAGEVRRRFVAEARVMARLRHPNVVDVWDYGEFEGAPYFVMEFYCHNLGDLVGEAAEVERASRPLRVDKAVHYARETLRGLAALHEAGVVHRDVKPANLLVTDEDRVKLIDFGLCRLRGEKAATPPGLVVGSPYYTAPEQRRDPDAAGAPADLFSVGVMLHRMLTGRLPEGGVTPGRLNPDLDGGWDALLGRLLAPDPDARPPGAEAALAELEAVYEAWRARREAACALPADGPAAAGAPAAVRLRAVPRRVPPAKAAAAFGLDGLRRPLRYHAGRFEDRGDGTVADRAAGLLWERGGSPHPLTWEEAGERVRRLGEAGLAGRRDWRLPTLEELMSLLTPVPRGRGHCIEPVFDTRHRWLWSADRASASAAWYANVEVGFVDNQDTGCYNFCRAVASLEEGP